MSEFRIIGDPTPVVGKEEWYSVSQLLPSLFPFQNLSNAATNPFEQHVEWSVHVLENGRWIQKEENNKTGNKVPYKFTQKSLERNGIRILAKRGDQVARLDVKPHKAESPKIDSIEFLDKLGNKPTKPFAYGQTLKARVHCLHMERRTVYATLWEDDVAGAGHDKANGKNKMKTLPGTVKGGIADIDFVLEPDFAKIADAVKAKGDADEGKTHEYYVTAEILNKKTASKNTNVANPSYKDTTAKPATPKKQTPAQKKGPSKKQEKEKSIGDDIIDWIEDKIKIDPIILPNPIDAINSVLKIFQPDEKKEDEMKDEKGGCYCQNQGIVKTSCKEQGALIREDDYKEVSKRLGVEVEVMKAIAKQESKRNSFWKKGQATILFERHKMWKYLKKTGKTDDELEELKKKYPRIVNNSAGGYGQYSEQYEKLKTAKKINYTCALKACSWGKFQVMGFNYTVAFSSPKEMEKAVNMCELQQFKFFVGYLENTDGLLNAMKNKDWESIAEKYNGSSWKTTNPDYANNLKKYYNELK
ncbi:hypothetical protein DOS84_10165 [Flavobacterium aquariorum]|uniref:N-acetylmuramidase domain-containing protein n=1 Tax=Flavobacterium aquariorum TaxID=2217670 RepID=A0A2W7TT71_9FLAO|nr:N-acetylmuramidase family protein [Flavobacterium aquariorum]PZX93753.1 hypothetical protein DOS84_10165 [Flavobacterium aquariorum]